MSENLIEYKVLDESAASLDSVRVRVIDKNLVHTLTLSQLQSDKAFLENEKMKVMAGFDAKIAKTEALIASITELVKDVTIVEPEPEEVPE